MCSAWGATVHSFLLINRNGTNFMVIKIVPKTVAAAWVAANAKDNCLLKKFSFWRATENARHENTGRSKMQDLKMRDINLRHQFARVEIAGHKNAGPICWGGKCGKS